MALAESDGNGGAVVSTVTTEDTEDCKVVCEESSK